MATTQLSFRLPTDLAEDLKAKPDMTAFVAKVLRREIDYERFAFDKLLPRLIALWKSKRGPLVVDRLPLDLIDIQFTSTEALYRLLVVLADHGLMAWTMVQIPVTATGAKQIAAMISGDANMVRVTAISPGHALLMDPRHGLTA